MTEPAVPAATTPQKFISPLAESAPPNGSTSLGRYRREDVLYGHHQDDAGVADGKDELLDPAADGVHEGRHWW